MAQPYRDLKPVWWLWLTLVPVTVLLVFWLFYMPGFNGLMYKEGPVEWLTIAVALTGAGMAVVAHRRRAALPARWLRVLPVLFVVGFIYMAGEECSWGQHLMNPRLPGQSEETKNQGLPNIDPREEASLKGQEREEVRQQLSWLKRHNDQSETNLHNLPGRVGDVFGKWPKQLIEFGSLVGCVIIPLFFVRRLRLDDPRTVNYWFWPTRVCAVAAVVAFLLPWPKRIVELLGYESPSSLRLSEPQELYLAIVLCLYIASMTKRLGQHQAALSAGTAPTPEAPAPEAPASEAAKPVEASKA